jgi:hypothetical protein
MSRIKKIEVSVKDYILIKENYIKSGRLVNEQIFGSRKNLFDENNKLIASNVQNNSIDLGKLTKEKFFSFIGLFNKNLYKNLNTNVELLDLKINFSGMSRKKNRRNFDKLPIGTFFYNLDLNSAYWQIVFKLGYIDYDLYKKYQNADEYKMVKRLCVSFLARHNRKNYYFNGKEFTVVCDVSALKQVYSNVRNTLYQLFNDCATNSDFIAYNIDSIYIEKKELPKIKMIFNDLELEYKLVLCQKIGLREYIYGNEKRIF